MKLSVVGLTGIMGSGKSTVAKDMERFGYREMSFATPLYRMATLTSQHMGDDAIASHELYSLLMDLFGGPASAPPFAVTASIVLEGLPDLATRTHLLEDVSAGRKPREFLQKTGDYFRSFSKDIFANYLRRKILIEVRNAREDYYSVLDRGTTMVQNTEDGAVAYDGTNVPAPYLKIVVSDVRYQNELNALERAATEAASLYSPIASSYSIVMLEIPQGDAAKRVALRDGLEEGVVLLSMGHATEKIDSLKGIDHKVDAVQNRENVTAQVMAAVTGKPESSFLSQSKDVVSRAVEELGYKDGTKLVDLSKFRKEDDNDD